MCIRDRSISADDVHEGRVTTAGAAATNVGAVVTVKFDVAELVAIHPPAMLFAVNVKLIEPTQVRSVRVGNDPRLFVGEHPPVTVKPAFHVLYAVVIAADDVHEGRVTAAGAAATNVGAVVTVKVDVAELVAIHPPAMLFAVNVKLIEPPQVRSPRAVIEPMLLLSLIH